MFKWLLGTDFEVQSTDPEGYRLIKVGYQPTIDSNKLTGLIRADVEEKAKKKEQARGDAIFEIRDIVKEMNATLKNLIELEKEKLKDA